MLCLVNICVYFFSSLQNFHNFERRYDDKVREKCLISNHPEEVFSEVKDTAWRWQVRWTARFYMYLSYSYTFVKWSQKLNWCLPATPVTIKLYLTSVIENENACGDSKLSNIVYSIKWQHTISYSKIFARIIDLTYFWLDV